MFEWTAPYVDPIWLERYLACTGSVLAGKSGDMTIIAPAPARTGDLDQYGDGVIGIGIPRNGTPEITGTIGETVAICYNMASRAPDLDLLYYPELLAQMDKSIIEIVQQCRIAPLLCTNNSVTAEGIKQILRQLRDGDPQVIVDENILQQLQKISGGQGVYSTHLVDPDYTHNAQYLAELWDVMLRRYCNMLGIDTRKTTKHAQVSRDEATGLDAVSWIIPFDMLKCRQRFCDDMKRITGDEWSVRFSDAWQIELDKYMMQRDQMQADINNTESEADKFEAEADAADDQTDDQSDGHTGTGGVINDAGNSE